MLNLFRLFCVMIRKLRNVYVPYVHMSSSIMSVKKNPWLCLLDFQLVPHVHHFQISDLRIPTQANRQPPVGRKKKRPRQAASLCSSTNIRLSSCGPWRRSGAWRPLWAIILYDLKCAHFICNMV